MTQKWFPSFKADRMHTVNGSEKRALCGMKIPRIYPRKNSFWEKVSAGPPKCKTCLRVLAQRLTDE